MNTTYRFDWKNGYTKAIRLCRSFNTDKEAWAFAVSKFGEDVHNPVNKYNVDIYKSRGKYKVAWTEIVDNNQ